MIGTLAELGVADELAKGPATAEELAGRLGVNADALHRVMRAASLIDLFGLDRAGRFSLARKGQPLRSDHPLSVRDWAHYFALEVQLGRLGGPDETVRTGKAAFPRVHGRSVWQWFAEHPDEERVFAGGMRAGTTQDSPSS